MKYGTTQERPWSTEHTETNGEGREYRKPARETQAEAERDTVKVQLTKHCRATCEKMR